MKRDHRRDRREAQEWARSLLSRSDWVILDTEATGIDRRAELLQLAVLAASGEVLLDTLVKPEKHILSEATRLNGITDAMVATGPTYAEIHERLVLALQGRTVVTYNADYRADLLESTARRHRKKLPFIIWHCAMLEYSRYVGEWMESKDDYKYQRLPGGRRDTGAQHGALGDCRAVLQLIYRMAGQKQQLSRITAPAQARLTGVGGLFRKLLDKIG